MIQKSIFLLIVGVTALLLWGAYAGAMDYPLDTGKCRQGHISRDPDSFKKLILKETGVGILHIVKYADHTYLILITAFKPGIGESEPVKMAFATYDQRGCRVKFNMVQKTLYAHAIRMLEDSKNKIEIERHPISSGA